MKLAQLIAVTGLLAAFALTSAVTFTLTGCEQAAEAKVKVEKLPEVKPSLPAVPTIPPPPVEIQYSDQSYSVYGVRRAKRRTLDQELEVTGYIVEVYQPPECPPKERCPVPPAPHIWIADKPDETDKNNMLLVADFAENQISIYEAIEAHLKGQEEDPAELEAMGMLPIPVDLFKGGKIKVKGRFAYVSGGGFQSSEGVLSYLGHETLQPPPDLENLQKATKELLKEAKKKKK
jgi:hypothetical protein